MKTQRCGPGSGTMAQLEVTGFVPWGPGDSRSQGRQSGGVDPIPGCDRRSPPCENTDSSLSCVSRESRNLDSP